MYRFNFVIIYCQNHMYIHTHKNTLIYIYIYIYIYMYITKDRTNFILLHEIEIF